MYLYGGTFEVGDKQITLKDFHCLDVHKLDEWKTLIELDKDHEWIDSESENEEGDEGDSESAADEGKLLNYFKILQLKFT